MNLWSSFEYLIAEIFYLKSDFSLHLSKVISLLHQGVGVEEFMRFFNTKLKLSEHFHDHIYNIPEFKQRILNSFSACRSVYLNKFIKNAFL